MATAIVLLPQQELQLIARTTTPTQTVRTIAIAQTVRTIVQVRTVVRIAQVLVQAEALAVAAVLAVAEDKLSTIHKSNFQESKI